MHPILIQAGCYALVMVAMIFIVGLLLKGFFWKYVKVRASFGKYILVKIKGIHRDYFAVGNIHEGQLIYKDYLSKSNKRIEIKNSNAFYRALAVGWIDVDEQKNCVIMPSDNESISGFDAIKMDNLFTRAMSKPSLNDKTIKLLLAVIILVGVLVVACLIMLALLYNSQSVLTVALQNTISSSGIVMGR